MSRLFKRLLFLSLFLLSGLKPFSVSAAPTVRGIFINGENSTSVTMKTAKEFYNSIDGYYINNIKVSKSNLIFKDYPTGDEVFDELTNLMNLSRDGDITIFYYSGHGNPSGFTVKDRSTSFQTVYSALRMTKGTKLVILDSCYSGGFIPYVNDTKNFFVITACEANTYSVNYLKVGISFLSNMIGGKLIKTTYFSNHLFKASYILVIEGRQKQ